jgi:hypothetical protein
MGIPKIQNDIHWSETRVENSKALHFTHNNTHDRKQRTARRTKTTSTTCFIRIIVQELLTDPGSENL